MRQAHLYVPFSTILCREYGGVLVGASKTMPIHLSKGLQSNVMSSAGRSLSPNITSAYAVTALMIAKPITIASESEASVMLVTSIITEPAAAPWALIE